MTPSAGTCISHEPAPMDQRECGRLQRSYGLHCTTHVDNPGREASCISSSTFLPNYQGRRCTVIRVRVCPSFNINFPGTIRCTIRNFLGRRTVHRWSLQENHASADHFNINQAVRDVRSFRLCCFARGGLALVRGDNDY